jgi:LysM repeat protein
MAVKRFLGRLILGSRGPFGFLWRVLIHPTLFYSYRGGRLLKKWLLRAVEPVRMRVAGRYAVHSLVVVMVLLVTVSNLQARELPGIASNLGRHSILSRISGHEFEDLVVEEAMPVEYAKEVTYLAAHAVRARAENIAQVARDEDGDPTNDILEESLPNESLLVNAIRVQSDITAVTPSEPAPSVSSNTRSQIVEHVVQQGENVGSIARKYGLTTLTILSANDLSARSIIRPGQKLKILPTNGILYTVRSGDTMVKIANKYKTEVDKVVDFNNLADAGSLSIGQTLVLPGGKLPPPPAPAPSITSSITEVFSPAADPGTTRLLWPTSARRVTQYYNWKHKGADIAGPVGTPIYAADDGVVTFSGWNNGGYGRLVIIDHQNGLYTRYAHASRNLVSKGDVVKRGDVIQQMGSTGRSTGPHIHFEVCSGSLYNRINPFDFIQ